MVQVDVTLKGPVGQGKVNETRKVWTYTDFPYPTDISTVEARRVFLNHLRSNIEHNIQLLDILDVFGYTITRILDMKQVYPI